MTVGPNGSSTLVPDLGLTISQRPLYVPCGPTESLAQKDKERTFDKSINSILVIFINLFISQNILPYVEQG